MLCLVHRNPGLLKPICSQDTTKQTYSASALNFFLIWFHLISVLLHKGVWKKGVRIKAYSKKAWRKKHTPLYSIALMPRIRGWTLNNLALRFVLYVHCTYMGEMIIHIVYQIKHRFWLFWVRWLIPCYD